MSNDQLQALTDGGVAWQLDHLGGGRLEAMLLEGDKVVVQVCQRMTVAEAASWLAENASQRFPDSAFARQRTDDRDQGSNQPAPGEPGEYPVG